MDATNSSRLKRMIAVAAVVTIPTAVLVSCSPSSSAHTTKTMPPSSRVSHVEVTTAAAVSTTTVPPVTTTTTAPIQPDPVVPETAPIPVQAPGCFADLAAQVGWPAEAIPHLTQIIERESHCDPLANTGYRPSTGDWSLGLLQINTLGSLLEARQSACGIAAREELLDPATNLRCGLTLYNVSGFGPWGG